MSETNSTPGNEPGESLETNESVEDSAFQEILEDHLDAKDYKIYRALNEDGRISDTDLGERVDLSRTAVRRRRKNLQKNGIIDVLGVLVLQEADLAYADVRLQFAPTADACAIETFIQTLLEEELIYEMDEYIGEFDLLLRIRHRSLHELKTYVGELLQGEDVIRDYEISPVVKTRKAWNKVITNGTEPATDD